MKQFAMRLWRKPWGKALVAVLYSAMSIFFYLVVAQVLYIVAGTTIIPDIGHSREAQAAPLDSTEMKRLTTFTPYTGPGSPTSVQPSSISPTGPPTH